MNQFTKKIINSFLSIVQTNQLTLRPRTVKRFIHRSQNNSWDKTAHLLIAKAQLIGKASNVRVTTMPIRQDIFPSTFSKVDKSAMRRNRTA